MTSPYGLGPPTEKPRSEPEPITGQAWPLAVAVIALVPLAIVVPFAALVKSVLLASWFGQPQSLADTQQQAAWLIAGTLSALLAVAAGIIALAHGHRAARVIAVFALALGLLGGAGLGSLAVGVVSALSTADATPASPPACGPDSHPAVFGPESRYTPCDDDIATAQAFIDSVLPQLPTTDVTVDAVGTVAKSVTPEGEKLPFYEGTYPGAADGEINAVWVAAPVTCAVATWDGAAWTTTVVGLIADGGC